MTTITPATEVNLEMVIGDDREWLITVTLNGSAVDITGATVRYVIDDVLWSDWTMADFAVNCNNAHASADLPNGKTVLVIADTDLTGATPGSYSHQCEVTDGAGGVHTIFTGTIRLVGDIA